MTLIPFVFPTLRTPKTWLDKCLKSTVSEDPSTSNMVKVPKHCSNLHRITFIKYFDHFQVNGVGKSLCYCQEKSWNCLLARRVLMKCVVFLIKSIERYQFRCNYLRNKKLLPNFLLHFSNLADILKVLKKTMTLIAFVFSKLSTPKT